MTYLRRVLLHHLGEDLFTHLVVHDGQIIARCDMIHSDEEEGCRTADNWVLVRPGLHSSHATP